MNITAVDPFDTAAFDAWHATYYLADSWERSGAESPWELEEARVDKQAEPVHRWSGAYAGVVDGQVVVAGELRTPLLDNLDRAWLGVWTHPEHRGRGYGSAMLAHLEDEAVARGRSVFDAEACYPYSAPADGAGHPYADFLTHRGFTYALGDVNRRLDLPVAADVLDRLAAEAAPHHAAYRLESFEGPVPDSMAQGFVDLAATLVTEAPTGELELEPEANDVAALRASEETIAKQGRTKYSTVALSAEGELVGYTELVISADSQRAYQWGTLVRSDHRGHRLGVALKVANLAWFQRERPDAILVTTYNAEVNAPMIGVNEALGFVPVERLGEFQKRT